MAAHRFSKEALIEELRNPRVGPRPLTKQEYESRNSRPVAPVPPPQDEIEIKRQRGGVQFNIRQEIARIQDIIVFAVTEEDIQQLRNKIKTLRRKAREHKRIGRQMARVSKSITGEKKK